MKIRLKQNLLLIIVIFLMQPEEVFAHRMLVEVVDDGVIQVRYDDGTRSGIAKVTAYDDLGDLLFEENVNENGIVYFDSSINIAQIVADDGMGHRATWTNDREEPIPLIPVWMRTLLGVSLLLFIASFFHYRNQKK
ncbi:hypothetical protein BKP35_08025 [Anaerobacillus arseniciselenatis]|uniref:Uncharacterized protein n=1 Tax=Anaerobacillus arseniciselenatis TaxID=85682 RepID=A0A1S2LRX5_9BACI|nr:hypothetical protein [Anaerobacillus arseniciselenatis]OIJ14135.1 hypothetical protein BKP35_08025 [Anaerobacillus arseniciselenatis]